MERIVSPGVFTQEYDQTFLQVGVDNMPATIVGPTAKGRAFVATKVRSMEEYEQKFGASDGYSYIPYAAQNYLANTNNVNIIKVLQSEGYVHSGSAILLTSGSAYQKIIGYLHNTNANYTDQVSGSTLLDRVATASFAMTVSSSTTGEDNYSASIVPAQSDYIGKIFGYTPNETTIAANAKGAYNYVLFTNELQSLTGSWNGSYTASFVDHNFNLSGSTYGVYSNASTPWITSQYTDGTNTQRLFRFKTITDGTAANTDVKVQITNIKFGSEIAGTDYGTFTVVVRNINDTDKQQLVLEQFNVNLDPTSDNFIGRIIGNKYPTIIDVTTSQGNIKKIQWSGDFDNKSNYIYVDIDTSVLNGAIDPSLMPFGFEPYTQTLPNSGLYMLPAVLVKTTQDYNNLYTPLVSYGVDFTKTDNWNYFKPIPENASTGSNTSFLLYNCTIHTDQAGTYAGNNIGSIVTGSSGTGSFFNNIPLTARKFILGFQGGFDGMSPSKPKNMGSDISATNTAGFDCENLTKAGAVAYKKALSLIQNTDEYDTNLLVTPGLIKSLHSSVVNYALEIVEGRSDIFYIMDTSILTASLATAISDINDLDTSYAATYYPWIKTYDATKKRYVWVPPSTLVLSAMSLNDRTAYEWYAPAGLTRGGISGAVSAYYNLSRLERDDLYENRINPIATFPNQGIVVWGQKNLQAKPSSLDRVNVRRLLINLKKFIASTTRYLVFEPNTSATRNAFLSMVNPYMESVQQRSGLYAFKVKMDEPTAEMIDRGELVGEIYLQPTKAVEFLIVKFNVTPTGASFGD
jgi:hypothetical protein